MPDGGDVNWFATFIAGAHNLRLLFAPGRTWQEVLAAFDVDPAAATEATLDDQMTHPELPPLVRAGEQDHWGYAMQHDWNTGDRALQRLSGDGQAFELAYTMTISSFLYAERGDWTFGFDMTLPDAGRWGDDPNWFATEIAQAGFGEFGGPVVAITSLRFVRLAFGLTVTPEMIHRPLPGARLPIRRF